MSQRPDNLSTEQIKRLAESPAGKQLLALLQSTGGDAFRQAQTHAKAGDFARAQQALSKLAESEQVKRLLQEMREHNG